MQWNPNVDSIEFSVALIIMLYKVVLTCESVDKFLPCVEPFNESYFPVVLFIVLYKVVMFWDCGSNPNVLPFYFSVVLFIMLYKVVLT